MTIQLEEFEKWLLAQEKPAVEGEMTLGKINEYRTHMCRHAFEGGFNAAKALLSQGELIPIAYLAMTYTQDINAREDGFEVCSKFDSGAFPVYLVPLLTEALQKELEDLKLDIANYVSLNSSLLKNNVELIAYAKQLRSSFLINMLRNPSCGKSKNEIIDEIDKLNPQPQCMQGG